MNKNNILYKHIKRGRWHYYISSERKKLDLSQSGKWMYFFKDQTFAFKICRLAIKSKSCYECKCTNIKLAQYNEGVICFYNNVDDIQMHKKIISFMKDNNLIKKTKNGKYYNISFKMDSQTRNLEYGVMFNAQLKLENFIDLDTGEFII